LDKEHKSSQEFCLMLPAQVLAPLGVDLNLGGEGGR